MSVFKKLWSFIMSLYIGKKSDGVTPLMHITTGSHDIATMNNSPISDTVFHSDLNYIKVIDILTYTRSDKYTVVESHTAANFYCSTSRSTLVDKYIIPVVETANGHRWCPGLYQASRLSGYSGLSISGTPLSSLIHAPKKDGTIDWNYLSFVVYSGDIAYRPDVIRLVYVDFIYPSDNNPMFLSINKTSNDILISNNDIVIGGVSLKASKFLLMPNSAVPGLYSFAFPYETYFDTFGTSPSASYNVASNAVENYAPYTKSLYMSLAEGNVSSIELSATSASQSISGSSVSLFSSDVNIVEISSYFAHVVYDSMAFVTNDVFVQFATVSAPAWYIHGTSEIIFFTKTMYSTTDTGLVDICIYKGYSNPCYILSSGIDII